MDWREVAALVLAALALGAAAAAWWRFRAASRRLEEAWSRAAADQAKTADVAALRLAYPSTLRA